MQTTLEFARLRNNTQEIGQKFMPSVETLGANRTVVVGDNTLLWLDPGGSARNVVLPAEASSKGLSFIIVNAADADEALTVQDDTPATVVTVGQNEMAIVFCNGTVWRGLVSYSQSGGIVRADLAADIIDGTKIEDAAVDSEHIAAGAVDLAHMSANSVDSDQYVDGSVDTVHLSVPKVNVASKVCAFGSFTDGGGTSGYIDFDSTVIPAGAIVLGWKAVVATGFTGDTTAVIQVGVSGDTDRFTADTTQSVLAAATVGALALAADAADGMNAAQTPRVTVTGGADFTSISAGSMTVSVYWIETA